LVIMGARSPATRVIRWLLVSVLTCGGPANAAQCTGSGIELQVLGSGGPELQDKRASSSYLIWRNGKALLLIDAGGGSALRFGQSGAQMQDLDAILLSHLHIDHTADLAALIKSSYFEERTRELVVYGPVGNPDFPSTSAFIADLFDPARGVYRYLGDFLHGGDGGYPLRARDVGLGPHEVRKVFSNDGVSVFATPVIHGNVPALAWRVETDNHSLVFSGDTNGENGNLQRLARGADVFVAHNAVPEGVTGALRALHMPPSEIGTIAAAAGVRQLVLSHRMLRTLGHEAETRSIIAKSYTGPVAFADDLDCFR
jgi:ribonuclease BN (tRNA processing enzyme)